jgi:hypothetical protein
MLRQGGVGFLGSTKVALGMGGWSHPNDGSSQSLDYYFTTAVTSGNYTQGQAHQWALREMYTKGLWYYTYYEMFEWGAFWGNPDLSMAFSGDSSPPLIPDVPIGPTEGEIHIPQMFSTSATDPESNQIYYCFSWGDGTVDWVGPYASGETVEASHAWNEPGSYSVMVKAQDEFGVQSDWSDDTLITITDSISVEITSIGGGFGAHALVENIGDEDVVDLEWTIAMNGSFVFYGGETRDVVFRAVGDGVRFHWVFVLVVVFVQFALTIVDEIKTTTGFLLGPFVLGV